MHIQCSEAAATSAVLLSVARNSLQLILKCYIVHMQSAWLTCDKILPLNLEITLLGKKIQSFKQLVSLLQ